MNIQTWLWCIGCERTFSVMLGGEPDINDTRFFAELEMQLGVEQHGQIYAECPYDDCDAGAHNFWSWETYRGNNPDSPEVPVEGIEYPLYPSE